MSQAGIGNSLWPWENGWQLQQVPFPYYEELISFENNVKMNHFSSDGSQSRTLKSGGWLKSDAFWKSEVKNWPASLWWWSTGKLDAHFTSAFKESSGIEGKGGVTHGGSSSLNISGLLFWLLTTQNVCNDKESNQRNIHYINMSICARTHTCLKICMSTEVSSLSRDFLNHPCLGHCLLRVIHDAI